MEFPQNVDFAHYVTGLIVKLPIANNTVFVFLAMDNGQQTRVFSHKKKEKAVTKPEYGRKSHPGKVTTIEILISKLISKASACVYVCSWSIASTS